MNVFSYLRVSGLGQVDKDGPVRQRGAIAGFVSKHSLRPIAEFFEAGVTGTLDAMERPEFAEMISKVDVLNASCETEALHIGAVVVESMDRLARDLMVSEFLLRECRKRNLKVFCANSGDLTDMANDGGDPTRTMLRQILGAVAQWDKTNTVKKLRSARIRVRASGRACEGKKPYGFSEAERAILSDVDNWHAIRDSYARIARHLNARGDRTRHGKLWSKSSVHSVHTQRNQKIKRQII